MVPAHAKQKITSEKICRISGRKKKSLIEIFLSDLAQISCELRFIQYKYENKIQTYISRKKNQKLPQNKVN
jgi:hypothetical protein